MAPGLTSELPVHSLPDLESNTKTKSFPKPLSLSGALEKFQYEETTPSIGREFVGVNIVDDLLNADNADDVLRDLAITSEYALDPELKTGNAVLTGH